MVVHRSSWVTRVETSLGPAYAKTYDYPSWSDRVRNWCRWTAPWRASRARREWRALHWLRAHGFAAPSPIACWEWRTAGFLRRATLLTAAFDGERADDLLARLDRDARQRVADAIRDTVRALHRSGFRDRNLDLRNLLVRMDGERFEVAKIDSPRHVLRRPGGDDDALARADWARLLPQLAAFGV